MSEFGRLLGLCQNCVRYNPKGVANCLLAKDAGRLAHKWKQYNLMVTDCELFAPPKEVFPSVEDGSEENGSDVAVGAVLVEEDFVPVPEVEIVPVPEEELTQGGIWRPKKEKKK